MNKKQLFLFGILAVSIIISFVVFTNMSSNQTVSSIYPTLTNEELIQQADLIVTGKVIEKLPSKSNKVYQEGQLAGEEVYTDFKFEITKTLKGSVSAPNIFIRTDGGDIGNSKVISLDGVKLKLNGRNVLFLRNIEGDVYNILGGPQGHFKLEKDQAENELPERSMKLSELENLVAKNLK